MLNQIKYEIPRRATSCSSQKEPFIEGKEIISLLIPISDGYERKDLCPSCFENEGKQLIQNEGVIYWKTTVSRRKDAGKRYTRDERALELLRESLATSQDELASESHAMNYVLALYLERRNQLVKRQEKRTKEEALVFYETVETGEVFVIKKTELTGLQFEKIQHELISKLST